MEIWIVSLTSLLALLIVSALCVWVIRKVQEQNAREAEGYQKLLDKSIALNAARDPLAYQGIQYMNAAGYDSGQTYDPSDEAEIDRIEARQGEGDLNGPERSAAEALADDGHDYFVPGF